MERGNARANFVGNEYLAGISITCRKEPQGITSESLSPKCRANYIRAGKIAIEREPYKNRLTRATKRIGARQSQNKKAAFALANAAFEFNPGGDLRSRVVSSAVSSARRGLTSVFGMGTGVTLAV